ncbi:hypothetical protein PMAYCL1PPCAC_20870, partial [Pristionchus mayeri]
DWSGDRRFLLLEAQEKQPNEEEPAHRWYRGGHSRVFCANPSSPTICYPKASSSDARVPHGSTSQTPLKLAYPQTSATQTPGTQTHAKSRPGNYQQDRD